jgi:hypothetical protein
VTRLATISTGWLDENPPEFPTYCEGNRVLSAHGQWAVTTYGVESLDPRFRYPIEHSRFTSEDWIGHLAEKGWVNLTDFIAAFRVALRVHTRKGRRRDGRDFGEWLCAQTYRDDLIGELADFVALRRGFRTTPEYLSATGASHLIAALDDAQDEWRARRKGGRK